MRFQIEIEERFHQPANKRWRAQFKWYPLGYFRGDAHSPASALAAAWRDFRREVDPGKRWWAAVQARPVLSSPEVVRRPGRFK